MEIIGSQKILTFSEGSNEVSALTCDEIRQNVAHRVENFMDLANKVSELQFRNRDFVLMFRGQHNDYKDPAGYSSLNASLMRTTEKTQTAAESTIERRFAKLPIAERALIAEYRREGLIGRERLERQRILRWAILQHYEICETPLLDVTQSLRIAASFASTRPGQQVYLFVLGIPRVSGAVTASAEASLQIVCLASVCPPSAVRPHIQEGYLLGEYPDIANMEQRLLYSPAEMDFGRRLIAKFCFEPDRFWDKSGSFPQVGENALYPDATADPMCRLAQAVTSAIVEHRS